MAKLFERTIHITAALSCVLLIIRWGFSTIPAPLMLLFTNPDGSACKMPCLFGIRPDEMHVGEALDMLRTHPLTRNLRLLSHEETVSIHGVYPHTENLMFAGDGGQVVVVGLVVNETGMAPGRSAES
jgi:hypothetical protein